MIAISITEWMNLTMFIRAIGPSYGPHVYLNGTLLFVAGLAIVCTHNRWVRSWPVLVTLVGWCILLLGLARMVAPISAQQVGHNPIALYGSLVLFLAIGAVLTIKSYGQTDT